MIMKHAIKSILIGGTMLAAATSAQAELETEIYTGFHSAYEFRGVEFGDDGLFDAGIDLTYDLGSGFSLNGGVWFADSYGSTASGGDFEEVDYYISLTKTIGKVDVSLGYTYYDFPGNSGGDTNEIFVGLATEFENGIGLSATFYSDYDTIDGDYLEVVATKSWELCACVSLDLAVGAAWSFDYNVDVDGSSLDGFNHYYISLAAPWAISEKFTLTPYIKFVGADNDLLNDLSDGDSEDLFLGGISLSYSF